MVPATEYNRGGFVSLRAPISRVFSTTLIRLNWRKTVFWLVIQTRQRQQKRRKICRHFLQFSSLTNRVNMNIYSSETI